MSLLQLLVDMIENQALRKAFHSNPETILDAYQVHGKEREAAKHANDTEIAAALKAIKPVQNTGETAITVVFCGVMKGTGHGPRPPHPDDGPSEPHDRKGKT